jgi:hypothetical protein
MGSLSLVLAHRWTAQRPTRAAYRIYHYSAGFCLSCVVDRVAQLAAATSLHRAEANRLPARGSLLRSQPPARGKCFAFTARVWSDASRGQLPCLWSHTGSDAWMVLLLDWLPPLACECGHLLDASARMWARVSIGARPMLSMGDCLAWLAAVRCAACACATESPRCYSSLVLAYIYIYIYIYVSLRRMRD